MGIYFIAAGSSSKNREKSLDRGHAISDLARFVPTRDYDKLKENIDEGEPVFLWGANREGQLGDVRLGEYVVDVKNKEVVQVFEFLFYYRTNDDRLQEYIGWDAEKPPSERRPYRFVYFLRRPRRTNRTDKAEFQKTFGETDNSNWLVGQRYFSDNRVSEAMDRTGSSSIQELLGISSSESPTLHVLFKWDASREPLTVVRHKRIS